MEEEVGSPNNEADKAGAGCRDEVKARRGGAACSSCNRRIRIICFEEAEGGGKWVCAWTADGMHYCIGRPYFL